MNRDTAIKNIEDVPSWDMTVIGGGATGLGIALDAASRGFRTVLFEQSDFTKATSSRSTKLVHGGVRYLAQGDVRLVMEALHERGILRENAPHLVKDQAFLIPCYRCWDVFLYTAGLTLYDLLAGSLSFGRSLYKKRETTRQLLPSVKPEKLKGSVLYHDGSFDDSRLAVNLAETIFENGGFAMNYAQVTGILKNENGQVAGVKVVDLPNGKEYRVNARCVINATGIFVDDILKMDRPEIRPMIKPSQGIHLVVDGSFLNSREAIMIPKTSDGRVLFAVPWHGKTVIGTTDTVVEHIELEPRALEQEIDFILKTAAQYLVKAPARNDVLSVFAGLRPLAAPKDEGKNTKEISRSHKIMVSESKLITIVGGKWTTYRRMAEDTVDRAMKERLLEQRPCVTRNLKIHGYRKNPDFSDILYVYGADAGPIREMAAREPGMGEKLHPEYDYIAAQVKWAVEQEMALTVEDVLARRLRALFVDAAASAEMAPAVAKIMARLLNRDAAWEKDQVARYVRLAGEYTLKNGTEVSSKPESHG